jgi:hypothetical protein
MRIDVRWYPESKRIIHLIYHAGWTWEDFHEMRRQAKKLERAVNYEVAVLQEYDSDAGFLPVNALSNLRRALEEAEANFSMAVLLAPSPFWSVILQTLKRVMPNSILKNIYFAKTREEALKLLEPYLNGATVHD